MFDVVGVGANSVDYVYRLPRYPQPDSPTAKTRISSHLVSCGGQVITTLCTCAALGLRAAYVGATGNDDNSRRLRDELARRGVNASHAVVRDAANPFAVILLDDEHGERVVLWDRRSSLALRPNELDPGVITESRLLHVDDVDLEASIGAASLARAARIPVTSDVERFSDRTEEFVAMVSTPIFAEHVLEELTGEAEVESALRALRRRHDGMLCVTRGAVLLDGDRLYRKPGRQVRSVDTTGAGDVFRGAFICALLRGDPPADILRFANAAAAISCTRLWAISSVPTLEEVEAASLIPDP